MIPPYLRNSSKVFGIWCCDNVFSPHFLLETSNTAFGMVLNDRSLLQILPMQGGAVLSFNDNFEAEFYLNNFYPSSWICARFSQIFSGYRGWSTEKCFYLFSSTRNLDFEYLPFDYHRFHMQHLQIFSIETLKNICIKDGYQIRSIKQLDTVRKKRNLVALLKLIWVLNTISLFLSNNLPLRSRLCYFGPTNKKIRSCVQACESLCSPKSDNLKSCWSVRTPSFALAWGNSAETRTVLPIVTAIARRLRVLRCRSNAGFASVSLRLRTSVGGEPADLWPTYSASEGRQALPRRGLLLWADPPLGVCGPRSC